VQAGWGHRRTVLWEYALMVACGATALAAANASVRAQQLVLVAWTAGYAVMILAVSRLTRPS
jgi:hypothetical protein